MGCSDVDSHIEELLNFAQSKVDLIITMGGLGPTTDDRTRDLISKFCGQKLKRDEASLNKITEAITSRGMRLLEGHKRQADFPEDALIFENKKGTANSFVVPFSANKIVLALPGPPREIKSCLENGLQEYLKDFLKTEVEFIFESHCFLGVGESQLAQYLEENMSEASDFLAYRASSPFVEVKLKCTKAEFEVFEDQWRQFSDHFSDHRIGASIVDYELRIESALSQIQEISILDTTSDLLGLEQIIRGRSRLRMPDKKLNYTKHRNLFESIETAAGSSHLIVKIEDTDDAIQIDYRLNGQEETLSFSKKQKKAPSHSFTAYAIHSLFKDLIQKF